MPPGFGVSAFGVSAGAGPAQSATAAAREAASAGSGDVRLKSGLRLSDRAGYTGPGSAARAEAGDGDREYKKPLCHGMISIARAAASPSSIDARLKSGLRLGGRTCRGDMRQIRDPS